MECLNICTIRRICDSVTGNRDGSILQNLADKTFCGECRQAPHIRYVCSKENYKIQYSMFPSYSFVKCLLKESDNWLFHYLLMCIICLHKKMMKVGRRM